MIGRPRCAASALFLSSFGLPVCLSFGSFSQAIVPQIAVPQLAILTLASPSSVSHRPVGSPAKAPPEMHAATSAKVIAANDAEIRVISLSVRCFQSDRTIGNTQQSDNGYRGANCES